MQEYLAGMACPLTNASLVSWRDMVASDEIGSDIDGAAVAASVLIASGGVVDEGEQAESKDINASK
jgi:hypothetical protein